MIRTSFILVITALTLFSSACGVDATNPNTTMATPMFVTATLPVTLTPESTPTSPPPTAVPTTPPIEGTTTTQVNVRAEPSTTSAALGVVAQAAKVQVLGKDASGTWYQILLAEGKGWIIAAYVQVAAEAEIPVIQVGTGADPGASVLVIQRVNVRTGPGTQFESVGILNPNDVAALTGKDPSGAWLQIEYAGAPEGKGWINAEFVQANGTEALPIIGEASPGTGIATPDQDTATPVATFAPAKQDGDSASAPSITVTFSPAGARALQFSGDVSTLPGDIEDWVQFTPYGHQVEIRVSCSESGALRVEFWEGEIVSKDRFACAETRVLTVQSGQAYLIRVAVAGESAPAYSHYTLKVEQLP